MIRRMSDESFMVLEFTTGDPGQENYRERPARELEPMTTHSVQQKQLRQREGEDWENKVFLPPAMRPGSEASPGGSATV